MQPQSLSKTRGQAATPMKRQFFEDNDRFIIDPSLSPFAKPQPRCSL
jgi:hypothetical protein